MPTLKFLLPTPAQPTQSHALHAMQASPAVAAESDSDSAAEEDEGPLSPEEWRAKHAMLVYGEAPPDPFQTFEQAGFPREVLRTVSHGGS